MESILYELANAAKQRVATQQRMCSRNAMRLHAEEALARDNARDAHDTARDALGSTHDTNATHSTAHNTTNHAHYPFEAALACGRLAAICECKKASPSKGVIAPNFPYLSIAQSYVEAGAAAISVLTEPTQFQGSITYLHEIATQVSLPCLRKDFIVDDYMIYEAKAQGAAAVLLIVSILSDAELARFIRVCDSLALSALVEVHNENEAHRAIAAGARIIGINNRNLHDFSVDIHQTEHVRARIPSSILVVSESGIHTAHDIAYLYSCNVNAVLIGEALMRARDKKATLAALFSKLPQAAHQSKNTQVNTYAAKNANHAADEPTGPGAIGRSAL